MPLNKETKPNLILIIILLNLIYNVWKWLEYTRMSWTSSRIQEKLKSKIWSRINSSRIRIQREIFYGDSLLLQLSLILMILQKYIHRKCRRCYSYIKSLEKVNVLISMYLCEGTLDGYRHEKWTRRPEFKSYIDAFNIAKGIKQSILPLAIGKLQGKKDRLRWCGNQCRRRKTLLNSDSKIELYRILLIWRGYLYIYIYIYIDR